MTVYITDNWYIRNECEAITNLRKQGNLDEAYTLGVNNIHCAKQNNEVSSSTISYAYSTFFWVCRDLAYRHLSTGDNNSAVKYYNEMLDAFQSFGPDEIAEKSGLLPIAKRINPNINKIQIASSLAKEKKYTEACDEYARHFSANELPQIFHEDYGWAIFNLIKEKGENYTLIEKKRLLVKYLKLSNPRPSTLHSNILNLVSKLDFPYTNFMKFFEMWGFSNFAPEDYQSSYFNGKEIDPLIKRIIKRLSVLPDANLDEIILAFGQTELKNAELLDCIRESHFWDIFKVRDNKHKQKELLFDYANKFGQFGASSFHSKILESATFLYIDDYAKEFFFFFCKWGILNISENDWKPVKKDDKVFDSIVQRTIDRLLESMKSLSNYELSSVITNNIINDLKILFYQAQTKYPNDWQLIRKEGLIFGRISEVYNHDSDLRMRAISLFKIAIPHLSDWYMWKELAFLIVDDIELRQSLLCKALTLANDENFIGAIRLEMANIFANKGMMAEAAKELQLYADYRIGKNLPVQYKELANKVQTEPTSSNENFYKSHCENAEEFTYDQITSTEMIFIKYLKDEDKTRALLLSSDGIKRAKTNINRVNNLKNAKSGDVYICRLSHKEIDPKHITFNKYLNESEKIKFTADYNIVTAKKSSTSFKDILKIDYAFVDYINLEKKITHIINTNSGLLFLRNETRFEIKSSMKLYAISEIVLNTSNKAERKYEIVDYIECDKEEAILNFPRILGAVDHVNNEKSLFHFVLGKGVSGIIKFSETDIRPNVGESLYITRYKTRNKENKIHVEVLKIEQTNEESKLIKTISGNLTIRDGNRFGFIGDYYVPIDILKKYNFDRYDNYDESNVQARIVFDGEKWKVFDLINV
jgi:hypothetical protein